MNRIQDNVVSMIKLVDTTMTDNLQVWENIKPIANQVTQLKKKLSIIDSLSVKQADNSSIGLTALKSKHLEIMLSQGYEIALKIRGYARVNNDVELLSAVDYSESRFKMGPVNDLINRCKIVVKVGRENLSKLKDYKVSAASLNALEASIQLMDPISSKRDQHRTERTTITANISTILSETRELLDITDDLVRGLVEDKDFIKTYFKARELKEVGSRAKKENKKTE